MGTLIAMGCTPSVITAIFSGFVPSDMNDGPVIWCYMANNVVSIVLLLAYFFVAIPDKVELDQGDDPSDACTNLHDAQPNPGASEVSASQFVDFQVTRPSLEV